MEKSKTEPRRKTPATAISARRSQSAVRRDGRPALPLAGTLPLSEQLCFAVYSLSHAFNRTYKPILDRFGLTYPQYLVLLSLWEDRTMTVKQIGERLGLDSGTLSPLLKRLDAAGLVERRRDRQDERQVIITLTEQGAALQAEAAAVQGAIGDAIGCGTDEVRALRLMLESLTTRLTSPSPPAETDGADTPA